MTKPEIIQDDNLSLAWGRAVRPMLMRRGVKEIAPLCVSITGFDQGVVGEVPTIRTALDGILQKEHGQDCATVANTIFPESMWNPRAPRTHLFERYLRAAPKLRKMSKANVHGIYFERLVTGGPAAHPNQLDFILTNYRRRKGVRRSALQVSVYDPKKDLTAAAFRGFPCLQHVTFAPVAGDKLSVNAFYATQYAFERAYGNYLGLCRLGRFVAHELRLKLARVTCFTGLMLRDDLPAASKNKLLKAIDSSITSEKGAT